MNPIRVLSCLSAVCVTLCAFGQEDGLRVGVARTDITPTQPVTLSGYASRTNVSTGIHDPLSARAVAFEHQGKRLVLISTDIIGFYDGACEPLRQAILDSCQLKPAELFLTAIHTHSAPSPAIDASRRHPNNVAYTRKLSGQLAQLAQDALAHLAPGAIGFGTGASPVGANRREIVVRTNASPQIKLGRNPGAMTDREVQVWQIRNEPGNQLAAVLFAYATHSTSMGPANYLISGDVHGLAEQFVEKHLGQGIIAPAFAGASGNIDPWYRVLPEFKTTNGWIPEPVLLGTLLGEEVVLVSQGIRQTSRRGPVNSILKTVKVPGKPRSENAEAREVPFNLTVGRIGDLAIVGLGGEVFNEIGKAIKTASPFAQTLIITHCNGAAGYLPIRQAYVEGGYEVQSSPFAPEAGEQVIQEALSLLNGLKNAN